MYTDEGYSFSRIMCVALTCCWSRLCVSIRKVLRPTISAQVLLGFSVSISECWDCSLTPSCYCMLLMQPTKIKSNPPPKFMFVMFDMYVKLPPDDSPIAVNKFYLLTYLLSGYCVSQKWRVTLWSVGLRHRGRQCFIRTSCLLLQFTIYFKSQFQQSGSCGSLCCVRQMSPPYQYRTDILYPNWDVSRFYSVLPGTLRKIGSLD